MISDDFIQELKYRNDIESVVSSYVALKRSGRTHSGVCPFHSEKTPSFHVYPETQSFYCFGCGAGGDVVTFIRKIENLDYLEALRLLAQRAGMAMPEDVRDDPTARLKTRILELNRCLARHYHQNLTAPGGEAGLAYLRGRGLSDKTIRRFGLGYAKNEWDDGTRFLRAQGFGEDEILAAAVASRGKKGGLYDQMRHRVIFPIIDLRGNVIGFGGRALDDHGPKYLNSSDTPVFKKSRNLFAMNFAKGSKEKGLVLAEGYMDVISIHQAGIDNAIATLGTSLTAEQSRLIAQYTDEVKICYDSDGAGQKATRRAIELFDQTGIKIKVVGIPDAKDPDEYIKRFGAQRFRLLLEGSSNSTEFEMARIKSNYDLETDEGKAGYLKELAGFLAGIRSPVERDVYISRAARETGVSKDRVDAQVAYSIAQKRRTSQKKEANALRPFAEESLGAEKSPEARKIELERRQNLRAAVAEDRLLTYLFKNPDGFEWIADKITPEQFVTGQNRRIAQAFYERLGGGLGLDMTALSAALAVEDMAHLSRLVNGAAGLNITRQEAEDCANALLQAGERQVDGEMSPEEIARRIQAKARRK